MLGPLTQTPIKRPHSLTPQSSLPSLHPQSSFSSQPLPDRSDSAHSVGTFGQRINPTDQDESWDSSPPDSPISYQYQYQNHSNPTRIPVTEIFLQEKSCPVDDSRRYPPPTAQIYPSVRSLSTDYSIETASKNSLPFNAQFYAHNTQNNASSIRSKKNKNSAAVSGLHLDAPEDVQLALDTLAQTKTKESDFYARLKLSRSSISVECPNCKKNVKTKVKYKFGKAVWVSAVGFFIISGGLLIWVPFCMRGYFQDVVHLCPNCNTKIGTNHRFPKFLSSHINLCK